MRSIGLSLTCRPRYSTRRTDRPSLGPKVGRVAAALGTPLMPWQQHVADVALEVDPTTGRLVYREVVLTVPRQSGKTTLILAVAVHRALGFGGAQRIVYAAQTRNDARKKWEDDHVAALEASPIGRHSPKPYRVRKTNGNEAIIWRNGSMHGITANTEKAGHGGTLDLPFIDEAFAQVDYRLEQAFKPAMITRPQPQLWVVSTAGTPESVYLWDKVVAGRERVEDGATDSVAYFEWAADPGADPGSVETWKACMPALLHEGNPGGTQPIEAVAAEYASMALPEFKRAFLNLWDARRGDPVISAEDWLDRQARSEMADPVALAFDVSPDRSSAAIGAASPSTVQRDKIHLEVVEHRSGTGWVVPRLVELRQAHRPLAIVCDAAGPAGGLLAQASAAGLDVTVVSTREHAQACGGFYDGVMDDEVVHIGQPELAAALDGADRRIVSDSWLWARRSSSVDICPLVAVTLAKWAWENTDKRVLTSASVW